MVTSTEELYLCSMASCVEGKVFCSKYTTLLLLEEGKKWTSVYCRLDCVDLWLRRALEKGFSKSKDKMFYAFCWRAIQNADVNESCHRPKVLVPVQQYYGCSRTELPASQIWITLVLLSYSLEIGALCTAISHFIYCCLQLPNDYAL